MTNSDPIIVAGWREWVSLPELGVPWIKAKLDTGARSSAIHAFDLSTHERDGSTWVTFSIHPWQRSDADPVEATLPVLDRRSVRISSGHQEERLVVPMQVRLVGRTIVTEMTLSRRDEMGFRLLIGREGLRQGFLVDAGGSYRGPRPNRTVRARNRGAHRPSD